METKTTKIEVGIVYLLPVRPAFDFLISNFTGDLVGVEIGTWSGEYAITMTAVCPRLNLYTVDNNPQPELYKNIEGHDRIHFKLGNSADIAKTFPDKYFDFIYVDGGHDYENVITDIRAWRPKLKDRGVFAGHDWYFDSVKKGVGDSISEGLLKNEVKLASVFGFDPKYAGGLSDWYVYYEGENGT